MTGDTCYVVVTGDVSAVFYCCDLNGVGSAASVYVCVAVNCSEQAAYSVKSRNGRRV